MKRTAWPKRLVLLKSFILYEKGSDLMLRFLLVLCLSAANAVQADGVDSYKLGAGDFISISVYGEDDLSIDVRIGSSGSISYPLLGDVWVLGLTTKQLETKLVNGLKGPFLIDPSVTVSMLEYRPFYVNGEVKRPGSYAFHPGLTVDRAISIAGGFTERASKNKIFVERSSSSTTGSFDEQDKNSVSLKDTVMPGDVLTIEQSFF
ncbi:polysaccharide biosynthesis/export family protein [Thalassolituus maritimus]